MKWYEKVQVAILAIPFLLLFLLFSGILGRLYWADLGAHQVVFYDSPSYRETESKLRLSAAAARDLLEEKFARGEATSGPGQHALICDNAYVFASGPCKEGVSLVGVHVDGMTGEIKDVDEIHPKVVRTDQATSLGWSGDYRKFAPAGPAAEQAQR